MNIKQQKSLRKYQQTYAQLRAEEERRKREDSSWSGFMIALILCLAIIGGMMLMDKGYEKAFGNAVSKIIGE